MTSVAAILMYHSVSERAEASDAFGLNVNPRRFREHLNLLSRDFDVVTLNELAGILAGQSSRSQGRLIVLTFDDGYANNLHVAGPLLREFNVPATLFLASGFLGRRSFWWEDLSEAVFSARQLPTQFAISGVDLGSATALLNKAVAEGQSSTAAFRTQFMMEIWKTLYLLPVDDITSVVDELVVQLDADRASDELRPLSETEAREIAKYFDLGGHTVNHPSLIELNEGEIELEVTESIQVCERLSERPVTSFSYPFGHFDATTMRQVEKHVRVGCSTVPRTVRADSNLLSLPRLMVWDWSPSKLLSRLVSIGVPV